jgi:hypothetical protein
VEGYFLIRTEGRHIRLIILPVGEMSKECSIQGIRIINANNIGNKTVQQNVISLSNLIRGKAALVHMKQKIIIELFSPKVKPYNNPSNLGLFNIYSI